MKKTSFSILLLFLSTILLAQNEKISVGLFKKWYVGAFDEVIGHYSLKKDSLSNDSIKLWIKDDAIFYDNVVFEKVYTVKAKPKIHFYYMYAENDSIRILKLYMHPRGVLGWDIVLEDSNKDGWEGIWKRTEPELYK